MNMYTRMPNPPRANYRQIGGPDGHLANRTAFDGNTMSAQVDDNGYYRVFSYATEIAVVEPVYDNVTIHPDKYSVTTTRQQNLCRAWL